MRGHILTIERVSPNLIINSRMQSEISSRPQRCKTWVFGRGVTDRRTDRRKNGRTDGRTNPLIEMRGRIKKQIWSFSIDASKYCCWSSRSKHYSVKFEQKKTRLLLLLLLILLLLLLLVLFISSKSFFSVKLLCSLSLFNYCLRLILLYVSVAFHVDDA